MTALEPWLSRAVAAVEAWQAEYGDFEQHPSLKVDDATLGPALDALTGRLRDNYPFWHPRYVGQMLKPPHPAAVVGYLATMLINPNNHALDGGPATAEMEKDVVARLAGMFGFAQHLGHLTSSGTIANLEALWVSRELSPGKAVLFSADAHYTHSRMCQVLGIEGRPVPTDEKGRMDLHALERELVRGDVGTVVATVGTTGLGALDPVGEIVDLARDHGARVHVDTAYGGFFALVADDAADGVASSPYAAIARADSVVVDPHKHGLQPYGCGAVLFADPAVGRLYVHDSPYTYFSSEELHLGEISLECSRAGAAAAALWLTMEVLPLTPEGLGAALRAGRAGALDWHRRIEDSAVLSAYQTPELDIVTYFPDADALSAVDSATGAVFRGAAEGDPRDQVHLATYVARADAFAARGHEVRRDVERARIFRSTVMKPESASVIGDVHALVENLTAEALRNP